MVTAVEIAAEDEPWWLASLPGEARLAREPGRRFRFVVPRVEPALFLAWLGARVAVERRRVERLDEVEGDVVVSCAGLGARRLAGDGALVGLAGQVLIAAPGATDPHLAIADDRDEDELFYAIPRRGALVLGGSVVPVEGEEPPAEDPAVTARILATAARFGLEHGPVLEVRCGVRPFRPEVRLERDGRIVHCYGHGGAGFTLCLGCAEEVASLL
jgi:D-amino-acid oxidase